MKSKERILERLAKIKALHDSEKAIGNEAAAQSFADKLQEMLLHHHLHMSDVEVVNLDKEDPVEKHFVNLHKHGIKAKRKRQKWSEELAECVAWAHFCRTVVYPGSNYISFVGRQQDAEVAEYMFVTLYRAIERIADKAYADFTLECVNQCAYCHLPKERCTARYHEFEANWARARGFRPSFVDAFVVRLAHRLYNNRKKAEASSSTALVRLRGADAAVVKYMEEHYGKKKASELGDNNRVNMEGHLAGRRAADEVNLEVNALKEKQEAEPRALPAAQ